MKKILQFTLCELALAIRQGEYSSEQVVQTFIQKIKEVNPSLNAVIYPRFEEAVQEAKQADQDQKSGKTQGKLHGIPLTIKECLDLKGTPSTFGLLRRKNDFPIENDPYVQALIDEGAIIIGKTNLSQLLVFLESDNPVYGRTNHPINPAFTCGGSSGGEGSIIAAGGSLAGLGTDLGGSVRIPAAFCGIMGLKPTMHRNYDFSRIVEKPNWQMIHSVTGVLGRHVEDIALLSEIIGSIPNPFHPIPKPFPDYKKINTKEIKVGYYLSDGLFEPTSEIKRGIQETIQQLKEKGISCKEIKPYHHEIAEGLHTKICSLDGAKLFLENLGGDRPVAQIAPLVTMMRMPIFMIRTLAKILGLLGQKSAGRLGVHFGLKGETMEEVKKRHQEYVQGYEDMMKQENIDVIISPVNSMHAYLHGKSLELSSGGTYTLVHNVTGFPSGVMKVSNVKEENIIPRKRTMELANNVARKTELMSEGLPVSIQITALPWREDLILGMMGEVSEI